MLVDAERICNTLAKGFYPIATTTHPLVFYPPPSSPKKNKIILKHASLANVLALFQIVISRHELL
jgi:hypothetical protein